MKIHPTHNVHASMGSSLYGETCDQCGATNARGSNALTTPCPNPMKEPDVWHKTLYAICGGCGKPFVVTGDREDKKAEPPVTSIIYSQCRSDGLYELEVVCPRCGQVHDLL